MGLILLLSVSIIANDQTPTVKPSDSTETAEVVSDKASESDQIVVYYLHMNRRCMTCEKLEAYSEEAISTGFVEQLKDSTLIWRVTNFETEGNEHFAKDYQLYSQSVILSRQRDGKELEFKNLDQIWKLVGDKEEFVAYIQTETQQFMNPAEEE
jgi:hypothetical protein